MTRQWLSTPITLPSIGLVLTCMLAAPGCRSRSTTPRPAVAVKPFDLRGMQAEWGWDVPAGDGRVPGIDYGLVLYFVDPVRDGGEKAEIYIAVWADFKGGSMSQGATSATGQDTLFYCSIDDRAGGHKVDVDCRTSDGKTGILKANDQPFDLAQGGLLLVSGRGGRVRIKQLKREGLDAKGAIRGLAPPAIAGLRTDPEVMAFFADPNKAETPEGAPNNPLHRTAAAMLVAWTSLSLSAAAAAELCR